MRSRTNLPPFRLSAVVATVVLLVVLAPKMAGAASGRVYFVAPAGSDLPSCAANGAAKPFATIQRALGCTVAGDAVRLAPSAGSPYPGIGTVGTDVTIEAQSGSGARSVIVDAGKAPLSVSPGAIAGISGVTLSCPGNDCHSATVTNEGTLTLSADTLTGNQSATEALLNTTPAGSATPASLTLADSTVSGNAGKAGGGVYSIAGAGATGALTLKIANSTISGNFAQTVGGGVAVVQPTTGSSATIVNSTITANMAQNGGGGLYAASPVTLANTIVAANTVRTGGSVDCQASGTVVSDGPEGHNLIGNGSGCPQLTAGVDGDQVGVPRPGLLTLADNGGWTDTVALQGGSTAIGAGAAGECSSSAVADLDQRGTARRSTTRGCDIGAFDTAGSGGAIHVTYFVAPAGSDAPACAANSAANPFATIQRALGCSVDGDVIRLAPSGVQPYPGIGAVSANVAIQAQPGAGARSVAVDAGKGELSVAPGAAVTVAGVALSCPGNDCRATPTVTNEGTLTLSGVTLTGNQAGFPAVLDTTPESSSSSASLTLADTTVSANAGKAGGGVYSIAGAGATGALTLKISDSTISGNYAQTRGGGVAIVQPTVGSSATIVNSTIAANTAQNGGGGIYAASPVTLTNTIVAANAVRAGTGADCQADGTSVGDGPEGHNLIGDGSGCPQLVAGLDGDQVGTAAAPLNARLAPLAYNGGSTESEPPLPGSPTIGAGSAAACLSVAIGGRDERGQTRNAALRGVCDVGAADTGGASPAATAPTFAVAAEATATASSPFRLALGATGSPTPAFSSTGTLPAGVTLLDNGDGSAALAGTPAATSAGSYQLTITAGNGVSPAATRTLTLRVATLGVTGVTGQPLVPGGKSRSITLTGSGFQPGATVAASSAGISFGSVKVKSTTRITARETVAAGLAGGSYDVSVSLPGATAGCGGCLSVSTPPAVTSISPATLAPGARNAPATITGSGFAGRVKVKLGGAGSAIHAAVTAVTATTIGLGLTVPATTAAGSYDVLITNGDGARAICGHCLTVSPATG